MKKFTFLFVITLISLTVFSQKKRANNWFFGGNAALNFASGTPTVVTGSQLASPEASAVMSDTTGGLLFYTDAVNVWNKNNVLMPNGTGLLGSNDATQGALIVPQPDHDSLYYLFTLDQTGGGLSYSIINSNLQGGLGDVTATKNVTLSPTMTEKLTAVKDPNSKRYWVAAHQWGNNVFELYQVNPSGLQPVITQSVGMAHTTTSVQNTYGQMKFSPCGNKIGCAIGYLNTVQIFDFNPATGAISNPISLTFAFKVYGFEFSPDGHFIYMTIYDPNGSLLQYDISSGVQNTIIGTGKILSTNSTILRQLQLANNGKIYVCQPYDNYMGVIANPNAAFPGCNYQDSVVFLDPNSAGQQAWLGLPNFVTSFMQLPQFSCTATSTVVTSISESAGEKAALNIFPNPATEEFSVITNETSMVQVYSNTGALIDQFAATENVKTVFGKNYAKGIYLIRMQNASGNNALRILKE